MKNKDQLQVLQNTIQVLELEVEDLKKENSAFRALVQNDSSLNTYSKAQMQIIELLKENKALRNCENCGNNGYCSEYFKAIKKDRSDVDLVSYNCINFNKWQPKANGGII